MGVPRWLCCASAPEQLCTAVLTVLRVHVAVLDGVAVVADLVVVVCGGEGLSAEAHCLNAGAAATPLTHAVAVEAVPVVPTRGDVRERLGCGSQKAGLLGRVVRARVLKTGASLSPEPP